MLLNKFVSQQFSHTKAFPLPVATLPTQASKRRWRLRAELFSQDHLAKFIAVLIGNQCT
jgi:hypothetical protein